MTPPNEGAGHETDWRSAVLEVRLLGEGHEDSWCHLEGEWPEMAHAIRGLFALDLRAPNSAPAAAPTEAPKDALDMDARDALRRCVRLAAANLYHHGYRGYGDDVLAVLTAFEGAPGADAAAALARRLSDMRRETERLRDELIAWQEREASVCPEGVGFPEYVGILTARVGALESQYEEALSDIADESCARTEAQHALLAVLDGRADELEPTWFACLIVKAREDQALAKRMNEAGQRAIDDIIAKHAACASVAGEATP